MTSPAPDAVSPSETWFNTGNAMSRAPICKGTAKLISPVTSGVATKKIMIVPWVEKSCA